MRLNSFLDKKLEPFYLTFFTVFQNVVLAKGNDMDNHSFGSLGYISPRLNIAHCRKWVSAEYRISIMFVHCINH